VTKIDSCLSNVVAYQISVRLLNKSTIEKIDKQIIPLLWASSANKRKYHYVKWKWIYKPKSKARLGLKDFTVLGIFVSCLLQFMLEICICVVEKCLLPMA
jgi:hypothetical protein